MRILLFYKFRRICLHSRPLRKIPLSPKGGNPNGIPFGGWRPYVRPPSFPLWGIGGFSEDGYLPTKTAPSLDVTCVHCPNIESYPCQQFVLCHRSFEIRIQQVPIRRGHKSFRFARLNHDLFGVRQIEVFFHVLAQFCRTNYCHSLGASFIRRS